VNAAEKLSNRIVANYDNPLQSSTIDVPAHVDAQHMVATRCRAPLWLAHTSLWPAELCIFDRDYAVKTAGSIDEHLNPDPDGFVVSTPMGR